MKPLRFPQRRKGGTEASAEVDSRPIIKRVLANAGLLLGGRVVNAVLGLAYTAIAARSLGVAPFGALVMIHAFAQLLGDVVHFESWQSVLQFGSRPFAEGRVAAFQRVLRFTLFLDLASTLVAVAIGAAAAMLFGAKLGWSAGEAPLAAVYMFSVAGMVSTAPLGLMRLFNRFQILAHQTALVSLVRLLMSIVAYALHWPLAGFLLAWGMGTMAGFVYLCWACRRELKAKGMLEGFTLRGPISIDQPGVWRFAWATNLNTTSDVAFTHVITLMVGVVLGPAQAALWRVGRQVADAIAKPARLLIPALYPEFARLRLTQDTRTMWRLVRQIALMGAVVGVVMLLISVFAGRPVLTLVMGKAFAPAAEVMTWQVAAAAVLILALPLEPMLISLGRAGSAVRVRIVVALVYVAVLLPVVKRFGINGAGAALVAASAALCLGMLFALLNRPSGPVSEEVACDPDPARMKHEP